MKTQKEIKKICPKCNSNNLSDGNSLNDSIDNLVMMTDKAHKEFHNKLAKNKFIAGDKLI